MSDLPQAGDLDDAYDTAAERDRIAAAIARGGYAGVVLVDRPIPDANAQHGENTADEMDSA